MAVATKLMLLLALVLALAMTLTTSSVGAQRILKTVDASNSERALSETTETVAPAVESNSSTHHTTSSSSAESPSVSLSGGESATAATTAEGSNAKTEKHPKGPTLSSFMGPMIAGAVAILLIGFVIAFKNRQSS